MLSNSSSKTGFSLELQPAQAWTAILGLILFTALCVFVGAGSLLRLAFPVGCLAVALFLYRQYPILYIGFSWWVSFLTPWLRRVIDYRSGWDPNPVILLAPYLVMLVTFITFVRYLPRSYREGGLPFILAILGVFYGGLVGLIQAPPVGVVRALLDWLTPILFGFHLFMNWRDYPSYRQNLQRIFLWGVLVMGTYGVVQYLVAPEWDRQWLLNTKLTSMGDPKPLGLRVWSTLNSVGPFSAVIMAGLLLLFSSQGALRFPAAAVGYLSFLLSQSRTGWLGWLLALSLIISSVKARLQMRLIITVIVVALCVVPLTTVEPFSKIINNRVQTLSNLENDNSAQVRQQIYKDSLGEAFSNGLGKGIGNIWAINAQGKLEAAVIDSGIIEIFSTLGWLGAIPYVSGLFLIFFNLFQSSEGRFDIFANTARAIGVSCFAQLVSGSAQIGIAGVILWGFLGISMAANKYYQHQRIITFTGRSNT